MKNSNGRIKRNLFLGAAFAGAALAFVVAKKWYGRANNKQKIKNLFDDLSENVDRKVGWDKLPLPLSVITLMGLRHVLRDKNLYDTRTLESAPAVPPWDEKYKFYRTVDGTYNDLEKPAMGSAGTRFGRNVPLEKVGRGEAADVLHPNPRRVSRELLTRDTFKPATTLNLLTAAWIQFMVRDWLSHGTSPKDNPWLLPIEDGDDWAHENPMRIMRTMDDPLRTPADDDLPPTHINTETHWWDASQIYGSNKEYQRRIRSGIDGKLIIPDDGVVAPDNNSLVQDTNLAGWWVGLSLMFTLFMREHNSICDRLKAAYPTWDDDEIFERARLVNAALLAKIHTVEWTTAILGHPSLQIGMRANWWGIAGEQIYKLFGRISQSEVISGIVGGRTNHFNVPYSITEEFVAVYRMHPLIPDNYIFRSLEDNRELEKAEFPDLAGIHATELERRIGMANLFYSFGLMNPGAIVLHNFPKGLQQFERPDGIVVDLAAHDILRSRELGVPRYNEFRRLLHLNAPRTFDELTHNPLWARELERVYNGDIEQVDLSIGLFAEPFPQGFGFSDTAFRIFILMASRRLNSDRFFTTDFRPEIYTPEGMQWLDDNTMQTVLLRHYPSLKPAFQNVKNAFAPWTPVANGNPI